MTELTRSKIVRRKTATTIQSRQLVVTLHPSYLELRRLGKRKGLTLSYDAIYIEAARKEANRVRAEKLALKKAKKK